MLISLFFKVHYFFDGTASTKAANDFIDQAEELATDFDFMPARTKNNAGTDSAQAATSEPYQAADGEADTYQGQEGEAAEAQTAPVYETYPPYDPEIENVSDQEF